MKRLLSILFLFTLLSVKAGDFKTYKEFTVVAGGISDNISANDFVNIYIFSGTAALTGNVSVGVTAGTFAKGTLLTAYWWASASIGSGSPTITIFGAAIPEELWTKKLKIESIYDGSTWKTHIFIDMAQADVITTENIIDGDIATADIDGLAVTGAKIANYTITSTKYDTTSIPALAFTDGTITSARLVDYTIQAAKIDTNAVTTIAINSGAVTTAKIADYNVTTVKLDTSAVTTAKITALNVTASELASNAVTTAKITDANVTTVKIADDNVTAAKLDQSTRTEIVTTDVSFVTADQGTYRVLLPYDCTLTEAKARVTSAIGATDTAYIYLQNNSATNMGGGPLKFAAGTAHGVATSVTPSSNNTFTAGQEILLLVQKTTTGGKASVTLTFERD